MGSWGHDPFSNDGAADFLAEAAETSPGRAVNAALRTLAKAKPEDYVEVDDGSAALAAAALVALAFGRGAPGGDSDDALEIARRLKPSEPVRLLALDAIDRLLAPNSELAELWSEGISDGAFRTSVLELRARLEDAKSGPKKLDSPKRGDVFSIDDAGGPITVQMVGSKEVIVYEGVSPRGEALGHAAIAAGVRMPCFVSRELRLGDRVGNAAIPKRLGGTKVYGIEVGTILGYATVTGAFGGWRWMDYATASQHDAHEYRTIDDFALVRDGVFVAGRVRSPDERERAIRDEHRDEWAASRRTTTPSPFGDLEALRVLLDHMRELGIEPFLDSLRRQAEGSTGYGRPSEQPERSSYVIAALVAVWRGTWPREDVPEELRHEIPPKPSNIEEAVGHARILAGQILERECALRMIWEESPDGGEAIRRHVDALQRALE